MARTCLFKQVLHHKKIGKSWSQPTRASCPTGRVAPIGNRQAATVPRREQNTAHSGRPAQQDVWHLMAESSSKEQDDCATKETPATVASLPEWDEDRSEVTCEWKLKAHLQACSWEVKWLLSESQKSHLAITILVVKLTCEWKSKVHLQARSWEVKWLLSESQKSHLASTILEVKLTCEWKSRGSLGGHEQGDTGTSSSGLGMEHPVAAVEVEVKVSLREVLSRWQHRWD